MPLDTDVVVELAYHLSCLMDRADLLSKEVFEDSPKIQHYLEQKSMLVFNYSDAAKLGEEIIERSKKIPGKIYLGEQLGALWFLIGTVYQAKYVPLRGLTYETYAYDLAFHLRNFPDIKEPTEVFLSSFQPYKKFINIFLKDLT